jgi:hypothetical protein
LLHKVLFDWCGLRQRFGCRQPDNAVVALQMLGKLAFIGCVTAKSDVAIGPDQI